MEFPKEYACPNCGSTKRVMDESYQGESIKKPDIPCIKRELTTLENPQAKVGLSVRAIIRYYDQCAECGLIYHFRVEKDTLMVLPTGAKGEYLLQPMPTPKGAS